MPDNVEFPVPGKGLLAIAWAVTGTAFLILLIDYKIKQEIVANAKKIHADIERYERIKVNGPAGPQFAREGAPFSGNHTHSPGGSVVAGTPGMEKAARLSDIAHGMGPVDEEAARESQRAVNRTYASARGRSVAVPEDDRDVGKEDA